MVHHCCSRACSRGVDTWLCAAGAGRPRGPGSLDGGRLHPGPAEDGRAGGPGCAAGGLARLGGRCARRRPGQRARRPRGWCLPVYYCVVTCDKSIFIMCNMRSTASGAVDCAAGRARAPDDSAIGGTTTCRQVLKVLASHCSLHSLRNGLHQVIQQYKQKVEERLPSCQATRRLGARARSSSGGCSR